MVEYWEMTERPMNLEKFKVRSSVKPPIKGLIVFVPPWI